jgi:nucleoside-diphosphate-sugar epimerase
MRILVTGAAGFIASHLCEKLHDLGHEVVGLDNFNDYYSPALKRLNAADLSQKGILVFEIDLNENLQKVFDKPFDYIYHLAAQPGISAETPLTDYVANNIFATQNLLDAVSQYNPNLKSFINIATSSVYGLVANVDGNVPTKPISFYGSTKLAAEQLVLGLQRLGKLNACSIRLYSVYGPRERPEKLYTKLSIYWHR